MKIWTLAGIWMLALPLAACSVDLEDGDESALEDAADLEDGDELSEVEQAAVDCSIVRKEWDDGAITIKVFKGNSQCNSQSNYYNGQYTGIKWECVEFARRYWIKRWGKSFGTVVGAKDICGEFPPEKKYFHGDGTKKRKGDMMVIAPGNCGVNGTYGHVGIIADKMADGTFKVWDQGDSITDGSPNYYASSCAKCFIRSSANDNPNL